MGKENSSSKYVRIMAAIIGIVSIFLPWESVGIGTFNLGVSLIAILSLAQSPFLLIGAISFVLGTVILCFHSGGFVAQLAGLLIVAFILAGNIGNTTENVTASLGLGFYFGSVSCIIAVAGFAYGWARGETPSA
jgi:hypothetical protein